MLDTCESCLLFTHVGGGGGGGYCRRAKSYDVYLTTFGLEPLYKGGRQEGLGRVVDDEGGGKALWHKP